MLFDCLQVSVRIPSTTLGGVECHNSSGAQRRAYCGTNDCVAGDRQERTKWSHGTASRRSVLRELNRRYETAHMFTHF